MLTFVSYISHTATKQKTAGAREEIVFQLDCDQKYNYMGRSPNYGRNSNIVIPDPYH
jgi:hypothetical protein